MKKLLTFIILLISSGISFAVRYDFTSYPASNLSYNLTEKDGHKILYYEGDINPAIKYAKIYPIENFLKQIGTFNFFRYGYFWKNTFSNLQDDSIDLSYLDNKTLAYPIAGIQKDNYIFFYVYKSLISYEEKYLIGDVYQSNKLKITQYGDWYIIQTKVINPYYYTYSYSEHIKFLKKNIYTILTYQVGQNPFDEYYISNFGNNISQLETFKSKKLSGKVVVLTKNDTTPTQSNYTKYGNEYFEDEVMQENIIKLYDPIKDYYYIHAKFPADLGALFNMYGDITSFNTYDHEVKYKVTSKYCYKLMFKPKSDGFKKVFSIDLNKQGFWETKFCIK